MAWITISFNDRFGRQMEDSATVARATDGGNGSVVTSSPYEGANVTTITLPAGTVSCQRELRTALQKWAKEAAKRDFASSSSNHNDDGGEALKGKDNLDWKFNQSRSAEIQLDAVQARGDLGHVCSPDWLNGVMARLPTSKYMISSLKRNRITRGSLLAGIRSSCDEIRAVERGLIDGIASTNRTGQNVRGSSSSSSSSSVGGSSNSSSGSGDTSGADTSGGDNHGAAEWPEACWPIPGVPFNIYSPFSQRRYLVLAAATEQLSNARVHLVEAARLAKRTGRILVLPKGANSRISLGRPLPICSYWDISRFTPYEWVSPEFYLLAAQATLTRPSVGFVWVQSPNMIVKGPFQAGMVVGAGGHAGGHAAGVGGDGGVGRDRGVGGNAGGVGRDRGVMAALLVHALGHVPCASNTLHVTMPARSDAIINMLHAWRDKDVIIWVKHGPSRVEFPIPSDRIALRQLPYSTPLHRTAQHIVARLPKPLIAVHYRSEWIAYRVVSGGKDDWQGAIRAERRGKRRASDGCKYPVPLPPSHPANSHITQAKTIGKAPYGQSDVGKGVRVMRWCAEQAVQTILQAQQNSSANSSAASVYIAADVPSTVPAPFTAATPSDAAVAPSNGPSQEGPSLGGPSLEGPSPGGPQTSRGAMHSASWASTIGAYGGVGNERERLVDAAVQGLQLMRRSIKGTVMIEELLPEAGSYDPGECHWLAC
ncbi:unnamed protein product [Closterium sp. Yama58-4]|nr:unnamed protein product [Closterium sp. Yama58-4]